MKPLTSREIFGTWATLLLPINNDESIDFTRLSEDLEFLLRSGVEGIYSNGTAGEFYAQTEEEFDRISVMLAEACERVQLPFQIGVSHTSAQTMLSRLHRAVTLKPSAVQVILPDWVKPTLAESIAFLRRMAEAAGPVRLVLYNPPNAKKLLTPEEYGELVRAAPEIAGIKVIGGDAEWHAAMKRHAPELSVFTPGHLLATGFALGSAGAYSNAACIHPVAASRWYTLIRTDHERALRIEQGMRRFITDYLADDRPAAAKDKLLAAVGAWSNAGTRMRWPYRWYDAAEVERLRPIARETMQEFLALAAV